MKLGIIRCMQTEDYCPGTTDFKVIREKTAAFAGVNDDIEIVGFVNCGGCPGKKALAKAKLLISKGANAIAFASCIKKGTPIGFACPFANKIIDLVKNNCDNDIIFFDYTH